MNGPELLVVAIASQGVLKIIIVNYYFYLYNAHTQSPGDPQSKNSDFYGCVFWMSFIYKKFHKKMKKCINKQNVKILMIYPHARHDGLGGWVRNLY